MRSTDFTVCDSSSTGTGIQTQEKTNPFLLIQVHPASHDFLSSSAAQFLGRVAQYKYTAACANKIIDLP